MRSTDFDASFGRTVADERTVRSVAKLSLATVALVGLLLVVSLLPGLDRLAPAAGVSVAAVITGLVSLAVAGLLVVLASGIAALVRELVTGPAELIESIATGCYWLVVLAAVLVAHRGLAALVVPLLGGATIVYDLLFLLLALPPLALAAVALYDALDPAADRLADRVAVEDR